MATAEDKQSKPFHSVLSLICAGSGGSYGTGRKMAIETNNKKNDVKISKQFIKDCVNLNGCDQDAATMAKYATNMKMGAYKSKQSCCDALLTKSNAVNRIRAWLKEDARHHKFYFSGHGTGKQGGGICFNDGVLSYKDLAKIIGNKRCWIIIDACYSGWIVEWFKNKKGVTLYYSSQKNQVSADMGIDGGYFTQRYWSGSGTPIIKKKPILHTYADGTTSWQTCGEYTVY
eukprot:88805_1